MILSADRVILKRRGVCALNHCHKTFIFRASDTNKENRELCPRHRREFKEEEANRLAAEIEKRQVKPAWWNSI